MYYRKCTAPIISNDTEWTLVSRLAHCPAMGDVEWPFWGGHVTLVCRVPVHRALQKNRVVSNDQGINKFSSSNVFALLRSSYPQSKVLLLPLTLLGKHFVIIMTNSPKKFRIDIPVGAWCFSYDVRALVRWVITMYCASLWASSDRAWCCRLHAFMLCRDLLIKHYSLIFLNFTYTMYFEVMSIWTRIFPPFFYHLTDVGIDLTFFSFHSTQVFLSPVKLLPTLMLWNRHSFLNKSPSIAHIQMNEQNRERNTMVCKLESCWKWNFHNSPGAERLSDKHISNTCNSKESCQSWLIYPGKCFSMTCRTEIKSHLFACFGKESMFPRGRKLDRNLTAGEERGI